MLQRIESIHIYQDLKHEQCKAELLAGINNLKSEVR